MSLSRLPAHLKYQILSHLDNSAVLTVPLTNLESESDADATPAIKNIFPSIDASKLSFFSCDDLNTLEQDGFLIIDDFLSRLAPPSPLAPSTPTSIHPSNDLTVSVPLSCESIRANADLFFEDGHMRPAGMNRGADKWSHQAARGDHIAWLNTKHSSACITREENETMACAEKYSHIYGLVECMDSLRVELDLACAFSSIKTSVQLARYPVGGRYVRHKDAFIDLASSSPFRRLTLIYYLNDGWKEEDGGQLRIFLPPQSSTRSYPSSRGLTQGVNEQGEEYVDCAPLGGRLLVFHSPRVDHEVLPSNQTRWAVTMWMY